MGNSGAQWRRRALVAVGIVGALVASNLSTGASAAPRQVGPPEPFADISEVAVDQARQAADEAPAVEPDAARGLTLNRGAMEAALAPVPAENNGSRVLELPAPDGTTARFDVWETPIMAPELAAEFPEISTYAGQGVDDRAATIVFDLTPQGFHAQVLSPEGNWYIDPSARLDDRVHLSYYRDDLTKSPHGEFIEHNADEIDELAEARPDAPVANRSGTQLRTHRLAVAANTNYSTFHGGSVASTQAAIVTAINRVTGIYEKEVAIRLQLVANNSSLIYTSAAGACTSGTVNISSATGPGNGTSEVLVTTAAAHGLAVDQVVQIAGTGSAIDGKWAVRSVLSATQFRLRGTFFTAAAVGAVGTASLWNLASSTCDPFANNSSAIDTNQGVVDTVIGDANYDVGHVFTTGSGGVAGLGVVGVSNQKARGTTGLSSPTADKFWVDFVAHELGHQYDGTHTWNGSQGFCSPGQWPGSTNALEPGSGSTIQAYAGICGNDDLQNPGQAASGDGSNGSDPYFHSRSFDQIVAHTTGGSPGDVGAAATGNNVPTANAGGDVTVPAQTPFFLTASGTDADPDALTYNWEQRDGGLQRALDNPQITAGPLFRSFLPTTDGTRYFPRLADVASGNTNQNGACPALNGTTTPPADCWSQFLIQTAGPIGVGNSRAMNFRATVRDNRANGGGVDTDDAVVTVHNTGTPFAVTSPNTAGTQTGNITVTWNVAGTTAAPVSAANVSIRLSTDGGATFPTVLAANTANDGSQSVTLPGAPSSTARVMVHSGTFGTGAGFFDMSDVNFTIGAGGVGNDDAANATVVTGDSGTANGSNVGATAEAGEAQLSCYTDTQINSVWWSWTAPASGTVVIDTFGSGFDTTLGVYTGTTLPGVGEEVGCNDDAGGGLQSQVTVAASQGTNYLIRVDGFAANTGSITMNHNLTRQAPPWPDFNGNGSADRSVFRPAYGAWFMQGQAVQYLGLSGDVPVPADYIGNDWATRAVFRNGAWYFAGLPTKFLGQAGDVPVPGDYDGDGADEIAVYRNGAWYVEGLATQFLGTTGDVPVPGDYDGDGTTERAVYRPSTGAWYVEGVATQFLGAMGDVPVPGDYDGDGAIERAVYRPVYGAWFVEGAATQYLGLSTDVVVPADYDGDGSVERAVFRPVYGAWFVEGAAVQYYGLGTDIPLPIPASIYNAYYVP